MLVTQMLPTLAASSMIQGIRTMGARNVPDAVSYMVSVMEQHHVQAMECCVEIPQGGVVRSLNVHVSGAIAVYEYTRRHALQMTSEAPG